MFRSSLKLSAKPELLKNAQQYQTNMEIILFLLFILQYAKNNVGNLKDKFENFSDELDHHWDSNVCLYVNRI